MDKFEKQFEDLDVHTSVIENAMGTATSTSTPASQVDDLIKQVEEQIPFYFLRGMIAFSIKDVSESVLRSRHFCGRLQKSGVGSDQIGSAPAPGKKGGSRRLGPHTLTVFILSS